MDDMDTVITQKDEQIEKLQKNKNNIEMLMEKNSLLSDELIKLEKIINNQREKMDDYEELIRTLETQIVQMKESHSINLRRNISFNYSFDNSISDLNNLPMMMAGEIVGENVADIKINALEKDIRELVVQKEELEQKLSNEQNEKESIIKSTEKLNERIKLLQNEFDRLKMLNETNTNELIRQNQLIKQLKQSLELELKNVKESFQKLKENQENFTEKFQEEIHSNCQQIIEVFNKQLETISLLSHFKHTLEIQLEDICTDNGQIEKELQKSRLIIEKHEQKITDQNEELKKFQQKFDEKQKEFENLHSIIDDYREKLKNFEKNNDNEMFRLKYEQLQNEFETMKMNTKKLEMKIKNLQKAYIVENQSFVAERKTKERLLKENMELEKEIENLRKLMAQFTESNVNDDVKRSKSNPRIMNKLPDVQGIKFEMADEEGEFMDPNRITQSSSINPQPPPPTPFPQERIKILRQRNQLLRPHLRTSYPVEFQNVRNTDEKILKDTGITPSKNLQKSKSRERIESSSASSSSSLDHNIPAKRSKL
uniref:Leucine-rich repeat-containing protein DDB_G0290503 n=1 Tax=Dermatophagoides pteronyssinus TaxID=6956 RepID=A0A6P6Y3P8_DERPT|nr:putative leucine-rich repeat-containing protein DDB_G0290503 [Dermatophagoides pteronyssinus]